MASYKNADFLFHSDSIGFDKIHKPGQLAPFSGIYRCQTCHHEVASNSGQPLPPQHEKPHPGPILWQLVVFAMHKST